MKCNYLFTILSILYLSCNRGTKLETDCSFPILEQEKMSMTLVSSKCYTLSNDFNYPRHSYLWYVGPEEQLKKYIARIGLQEKNDSTILLSNLNLNEYANGRLWDNEAIYETEIDSNLKNEYHIPQEYTYAAYFNSGKKNIIFDNPNNNWNGKIVAFIRNDSCLFFIEELKDPKFIRVDSLIN